MSDCSTGDEPGVGCVVYTATEGVQQGRALEWLAADPVVLTVSAGAVDAEVISVETDCSSLTVGMTWDADTSSPRSLTSGQRVCDGDAATTEAFVLGFFSQDLRWLRSGESLTVESSDTTVTFERE